MTLESSQARGPFEQTIATSCGAEKIDHRINWTWALKFPSMEKATECATILRDSGSEVLGPHDFGDAQRGIAVGWRWRNRQST